VYVQERSGKQCQVCEFLLNLFRKTMTFKTPSWL